MVYNRGTGHLHGTSRGSLQRTIRVPCGSGGRGSAKSCCPCSAAALPIPPRPSAREIRAAIKAAARRGCRSWRCALVLLLLRDRVGAPSECAGPRGPLWALHCGSGVFVGCFFALFLINFIFMWVFFFIIVWGGFFVRSPSPLWQTRP